MSVISAVSKTPEEWAKRWKHDWQLAGEQRTTEQEEMNAKQRRKQFRADMRTGVAASQIQFPTLDEVRAHTIMVRLFPERIPWAPGPNFNNSVFDESTKSIPLALEVFFTNWNHAKRRIRQRGIHAGYFLGVPDSDPHYHHYVVPIDLWTADLKIVLENLRERASEVRRGGWGKHREEMKQNCQSLFVDWELATLDDLVPRIDDPERALMYWHAIRATFKKVKHSNGWTVERLVKRLKAINESYDPNYPPAKEDRPDMAFSNTFRAQSVSYGG